MADVARSIRTAKKTESLPPWRTTAGMVLALLRRCTELRISYGEGMRRSVSYWLTHDQFHDFESRPVVHGASLFEDSAFDQESRVSHGDAKRGGR